RLLPAPSLSDWTVPFYIEIDIEDFLRPGTNVLQIATISLLEEMPYVFEPIYIIGDFEVRGRSIRPASRRMSGLWNENGYPHYSGIAAYSQKVDIPAKYALGAALVLQLEQVHDCCRVMINGDEAGIRLWPPWEVDISRWVVPGVNEIRIEVANSAANLYDKDPRPSGLAGAARIIVRER
ncbi:MAG: hypothetical protein H5T86_13765, partial [Armatimonadetes bacterium]|nr:hypothetical protein [Armatimonadota bacterium]